MGNNYLVHSAKGNEWKNHKYYIKVPIGHNKNLYFYTKEEYQSYLKTGKTSNSSTVGKLGDDEKSKARKALYEDVSNKLNDATKRASKNITQYKKNASKNISKITRDVSEYGTENSTVGKLGDDTKSKARKAFYKELSEKIDAASDRASKNIEQYKKNASKNVSKITRDTSEYGTENSTIVSGTRVSELSGKANVGKDFVKNLKTFTKHSITKAKQFLAKNFGIGIPKNSTPSNPYDKAIIENARDKAIKDAAAYTENRKKASSPLNKNIEDLPIISHAESEEERLKEVNPHYSPDNYWDGYSNNCADCSLAYELRSRGYDVTAIYNAQGTYTDTVESWFENEDGSEVHCVPIDDTITDEDKDDINGYYPVYSDEAIASMEEKLAKDSGEGSRGFLSIRWYNGGGHSCIYTVENGKVNILDAQTGEKLDFEEYASLAYDIKYFRSDDKVVTENAKSKISTDDVKRAQMNTNGDVIVTYENGHYTDEFIEYIRDTNPGTEADYTDQELADELDQEYFHYYDEKKKG